MFQPLGRSAVRRAIGPSAEPPIPRITTSSYFPRAPAAKSLDLIAKGLVRWQVHEADASPAAQRVEAALGLGELLAGRAPDAPGRSRPATIIMFE